MKVRKVRTLVLGLFLAGALVAGWFAWRWYTAPVPPEIPLKGVEEHVADMVQEAVGAIRRQPRSGKAWGQLGMILAANGFDEYVPRCYAEAKRFDPNNPDWPYLHGLYLLEVHPNQAFPFLEEALSLARDAEEKAAIHFRLAQALHDEEQLDRA